jgi:hypothetical protein
MTPPSDNQREGQRIPHDFTPRPASDTPTWQEYLLQHPNGGGFFNDWLLKSIETLIQQNAEVWRRIVELERRLDQQEGGK